MNELHGIIFAYRSNPALRELTQHRNTCSIPYGGRYRIIDFMLSNMVNAGVSDVGLIVHANYQSLLDHVGAGKDWDLSRKHGGLRILPPFGYAPSSGVEDYIGRMDALVGVYSYLQKIRQDYVILAGGDIVANLPFADVFEQHLKSGADITAVCVRPSGNAPSDSNYFSLGPDGTVSDVTIRPTTSMEYESAECYILSRALLMRLVDHAAAHKLHSFTEEILLSMVHELKVVPYVYDGYLARIHSVADYFARQMELLDPAVRADLFAPSRPIRTKDHSNPSTRYGPSARSQGSLIADGCIIEGEVENSILFRGVTVEQGAKVSNCILMQSTTIHENAVLAYAIADKDVTIHSGRMLMGHVTYPLTIAKNSVI